MTIHIIRTWRNTKFLRVWKLSCFSRGNSRFKHDSTNECSPSIHDQGKMLNLFFLFSDFRIGTTFCFLPTNFTWSTCTDENHPFWRVQEKTFPIGNFLPTLQHYDSLKLSLITVLPRNHRTDFAQEERLGLPNWTMIVAICVVVDESKSLDIPILDFFETILWAPSIFGYKRILHPLLVFRTLAVWIWCEWLLLLSFKMLMILGRWILQKILNRLSQCRLEVQLDLGTFGALPPIRQSVNDMSINDAKWTFSLSLLLRRSLFFF